MHYDICHLNLVLHFKTCFSKFQILGMRIQVVNLPINRVYLNIMFGVAIQSFCIIYIF